MSVTSDVSVKLDDRVRLMSAALAASSYPQDEQARQRHGTHAHARATRARMSAYAEHPAVRTLQGLLDEEAPLEAIYMFALLLRLPDGRIANPPAWMPPDWDAQLNDFYAVAGLADWWQSEAAAWQKALDDSKRVFESVQVKEFLKPFLGEIKRQMIFIPNISYPTDHELGFRLRNDLVCVAPPRLAWGDSPPWPYDEDPAHVYRAALSQYGRLLVGAYLRSHAEQVAAAEKPLPVSDSFKAIYPTWAEQFTSLFVAGLVAIYLEDHVNKAEANAYVLMERKLHSLEILPGVINVLRHYLRELETGRYQTLLDLLPNFSRRLKVANRIISL
ncbi:MAG: hypothetical protein IT319_12325 [Anaerolineae bacterium]|nr:hypothetical protein [Anaerolineae bacterium]